ncbi:MAG: hypothetical protein JRH16_03235 [Deltaproteobacteria bacterium]|nr:hypothetical protein [Deltaproteobacteria bacterium]MBW2363002.1 hypothetical protein [Deltaproteobacteria bacterium]
MANASTGPAQPAIALSCCVLVCLVLACASTGAPEPSRPEADTGRERQRGVLAKTTPTAVTAATQTGNPAPKTDVQDSANAGDARPGRMLIYSAITGHVPLDELDPDDPTTRYRTPAEREAARARKIEAEIEAEIARENRLAVEPEVAPPPAADPAAVDPTANPLSAPQAPQLRELPGSLFESHEVTIPPGEWQNRRELTVVRQTLDVDDDGAPEELRYTDVSSGQLVRAELDRDFDGRLDTWISYENGEPAIQVIDSNGDARADTWERYTGGQLEARTVDRDHDGVKDTFFRYDGGELSTLQRDANNDGTVDRVESYQGRHRARTEEDRTLNGYMDIWTRYAVIDQREVVTHIERDTRDQGKPDVFETYETEGEETLLARKEEDIDGDGNIDVVSSYEDGRLVQRAISDEALSPL